MNPFPAHIRRLLGPVLLLAFAAGCRPSGDDPSPADARGQFWWPADADPVEAVVVDGDALARRFPDLLVGLAGALPDDTPLLVLGDRRRPAPVDSFLATRPGLAARIRRLPVHGEGVWARDWGPQTVTDSTGRRSFVGFARRERRRGGPQPMVHGLGMAWERPVLTSRLTLDGGEILSNGHGLALVGAGAVARNAEAAGRSSDWALGNVAALLGCERLVTLPGAGPGGVGPLDRDLVFLAPDLVVVARAGDGEDPAAARRLDLIAADLEGLASGVGPLQVRRLDRATGPDGAPRPNTDVVFADGVVLVPVYDDLPDAANHAALDFYRIALPERQVVGVEAGPLVRAGGGLRRACFIVSR